MAVDRSRLKARAAAGDASAKRALAVTQRTSFMLSGAQLGITVTALVVGFVAEPLIGASLGEALGGIGLPAGVGVAVSWYDALPRWQSAPSRWLEASLDSSTCGAEIPEHLRTSPGGPRPIRVCDSVSAPMSRQVVSSSTRQLAATVQLQSSRE